MDQNDALDNILSEAAGSQSQSSAPPSPSNGPDALDAALEEARPQFDADAKKAKTQAKPSGTAAPLLSGGAAFLQSILRSAYNNANPGPRPGVRDMSDTSGGSLPDWLSSLANPGMASEAPARLSIMGELLKGSGAGTAAGKGGAKLLGGALLGLKGHPILGLGLAGRGIGDASEAAKLAWNAFKASGGGSMEEFEQYLKNSARVPQWTGATPPPPATPPTPPLPGDLKLPSGRTPGSFATQRPMPGAPQQSPVVKPAPVQSEAAAAPAATPKSKSTFSPSRVARQLRGEGTMAATKTAAPPAIADNPKAMKAAQDFLDALNKKP